MTAPDALMKGLESDIAERGNWKSFTLIRRFLQLAQPLRLLGWLLRDTMFGNGFVEFLDEGQHSENSGGEEIRCPSCYVTDQRMRDYYILSSSNPALTRTNTLPMKKVVDSRISNGFFAFRSLSHFNNLDTGTS